MYDSIARVYDGLNAEIDYKKWADFIEKCFDKYLKSRPEIVLDLACGTGKMTRELEKLGFEFCTEPGENELKYALDNMYWQGSEGTTIEDLRGGMTENFHKLHAVVYNYFNYWVWEAYYPVIKKHYPDADV